mgnify:FL=1
MKKLIASMVVFGVLFTSSTAHALRLSDLQKEVENLKQEIVSLRSMMSGAVLGVVTPTTTYSLGMRNTEIIKFQQALRDQRYLASGNATGVFGPLTYTAVKNFQIAKGLKADGVLGSETQTSLMTMVGGPELACVSNTWKKRVDVPGERRHGAVGFSLNGKGYMGTGFTYNQGTNDIYHKDFWEYSPTTNTWAQKADFGGDARTEAVGFSIGNKGYLGTGEYLGAELNGVPVVYNDFWEYNPTTNTWVQKSDFGGGQRSYATGFSIGNKGYVGIGFNSTTSDGKDFWEYDPKTDKWVKKAPFSGGIRYDAVGFSIGTKGYVGTGNKYGDGSPVRQKDFWEYNPTTNAWVQKMDFGGGVRAGAVAFSMDGKGYVGVGRGDVGSNDNDFWEYNPSTNKWTQKAPYIYGSPWGAIGFSIGKRGYLGSGSSSQWFAEYCPGVVN